jgi:LmbE family N-acetylglucosaminyl deacetylase
MDKSFSLYYYEVSNGEDTQQFAPAYYVDVSAFEPVKRAACYAHASQSPDRFYTLQDSVAAFRGIESGYKRAEAFLLHRGCARDVLPIALTS